MVNPSAEGFWLLEITSSHQVLQIPGTAQEPEKQQKNAVTWDEHTVLPRSTVTASAIFCKHLEKQEQSVQGPLAYFTSNHINKPQQLHLCSNFLSANYLEDHIHNPKTLLV